MLKLSLKQFSYLYHFKLICRGCWLFSRAQLATMSANPTEMIPQSRIRSGERVRVSASFHKNPTPLGSVRDGTTGWWQFIEVFCRRVMSEGDIFRLVPRARSHLRYVSSNQLAQLYRTCLDLQILVSKRVVLPLSYINFFQSISASFDTCKMINARIR